MKNYTVTVCFKASSSEDANEVKHKIAYALWLGFPWAARTLEVYGPEKLTDVNYDQTNKRTAYAPGKQGTKGNH